MVIRSLAAVLICASSLGAEEFTTDAQSVFASEEAKAAEQVYEEALRVARAAYIEQLTEAGLAAAEANDLDEAIQIKEVQQQIEEQQASDEGDPIVRARKKVQESRWTWNRPRDPNTIRFSVERKVKTGKGAGGVWEMLEPQTLIIKFGEELFLLHFDEEFESFGVRAYAPVETRFTSGRRVN